MCLHRAGISCPIHLSMLATMCLSASLSPDLESCGSCRINDSMDHHRARKERHQAQPRPRISHTPAFTPVGNTMCGRLTGSYSTHVHEHSCIVAGLIDPADVRCNGGSGLQVRPLKPGTLPAHLWSPPSG